MIQVRKGMFETNSSSANVLIIPKDQNIHVPKRLIYIDDETSRKPSEIVLYNLMNGFRMSKDTIDVVINFLYNNGVEEIIYGGRNSYIAKAIEMYREKPVDMGVPSNWDKKILLFALFGDETECHFYADGDHRPNADADEYDENWYREYSAD